MQVERLHLINDNGGTELRVVMFRPEEIGEESAYWDPGPEGLGVVPVGYEVHEN